MRQAARRPGAFTRITRKQRFVLLQAEHSCWVRSKIPTCTVLSLVYKGYLRHVENGWYLITQRGHDLLRFGIRR